MVVNHDGQIVAVGPEATVESEYGGRTFASIIDMTGKSLIPGLVDAHTHPVWSGERVHEFIMKLAGATYMEIHEKGGGIGFTVQHTRASSESHLLELFLQRLARMLKFGTTTLEAKSSNTSMSHVYT